MKQNRPTTDKRNARAAPNPQAAPHRPTAPNPQAARLFAYLDGEMSPTERTAFEAEAAANPALGAQVRAFRSIFASIEGMRRPSPPPDLEAGVIAALQTRPAPLRRLWHWLAGSLHEPPPGPFNAMLDGRLAARHAAALSALAARDAKAAQAIDGWRRLGRELSRLPHLSPSNGFADRVMAQVRLPEPVASRRGRLLRPLGLWPRRQERLAAVSGIAFGPTATVAGVAYLLFLNHPLVTLSNLGAFLVDRGMDALLGISQGLFDLGLAFPSAPGGLAPTVFPPAILGGLLLVGGLTLASAWILHRNVFRTPAEHPTASERRHASV